MQVEFGVENELGDNPETTLTQLLTLVYEKFGVQAKTIKLSTKTFEAKLAELLLPSENRKRSTAESWRGFRFMGIQLAFSNKVAFGSVVLER